MPLILRPIAKYADFTGRARRAEYWQFLLFQIFIYVCLGIIFGLGLGKTHTVVETLAGFVIAVGVFGLFCLLPNLAVMVRRLHDTGKSAWWLLLYLPSFVSIAVGVYQVSALRTQGLVGMHDAGQNPLLGLACLGARVYLLYLMRKRGDAGANAYGPDPKQPFDIAGIFDAPEPAHETAEPYRPVFDFGPATRQPAPYTPAPMLAPSSQTRTAPVFGKRR